MGFWRTEQNQKKKNCILVYPIDSFLILECSIRKIVVYSIGAGR